MLVKFEPGARERLGAEGRLKSAGSARKENTRMVAAAKSRSGFLRRMTEQQRKTSRVYVVTRPEKGTICERENDWRSDSPLEGCGPLFGPGAPDF